MNYMGAINSPVDKIIVMVFHVFNVFNSVCVCACVSITLSLPLMQTSHRHRRQRRQQQWYCVISSTWRSRFCCAPKYVISRVVYVAYKCVHNNCYDFTFPNTLFNEKNIDFSSRFRVGEFQKNDLKWLQIPCPWRCEENTILFVCADVHRSSVACVCVARLPRSSRSFKVLFIYH